MSASNSTAQELDPDLQSPGLPSRLRQRAAALALAGLLHLLQLTRAHGQTDVGFRHEFYVEDNHRIRVDTDTMLFSQKATPWLSLKGEVVYDAISGQTPSGAPPPPRINWVTPPTVPLGNSVALTHMVDHRTAGNLETTFSFGPNRITPQFAYSQESDYISRGLALAYAVDLNQKNTTLNFGYAHDSDTVQQGHSPFLFGDASKETDDAIMGVTQLLGPKTVLTVNFSYGHDRGYLNDPYRGVIFSGYKQSDPGGVPDGYSFIPESRPHERDRYVGFVSLTQYLAPLKASVEGSYRLGTDSYGIQSHTVEVTWFQKVGRHVVIAPDFRYYNQTAADFYSPVFPGTAYRPTTPAYYSADYRLSELQTITGGISVTWKVRDWLSVDAGYKRYIMQGLDHSTSSSVYPSANIFTLGAHLWF